MRRVVELELWSRPGMAPLNDSGKAIASTCQADLDLPSTVVLGLSFVPDATDITNLRLSLEAGEVTGPAFYAFCNAHGLPCDVASPLSAASFLVQEFGQPHAWLHLPHNAEGKNMYLSVAAWAQARKLVVVEPLAETCCLLGGASASHYWHAVA